MFQLKLQIIPPILFITLPTLLKRALFLLDPVYLHTIFLNDNF